MRVARLPMRLRTRRPASAVLASITSLLLAASGCASLHNSGSLIARPYRQETVAACLRQEKITFGSSPEPQGSGLRAIPGVKGSIIIPRGGPPSAGFGPSIDPATLIFVATPDLARRDRDRLYTAVYLPPPPGIVASLTSVRGNVVILWGHPRQHPRLSRIIVDKCLPTG